jgi:hypothetical protein
VQSCCRSPFPSKKAITLLKNEPFNVRLSYDEADGRLPPHINKSLGTYRVELPKVSDAGCVLGPTVSRSSQNSTVIFSRCVCVCVWGGGVDSSERKQGTCLSANWLPEAHQPWQKGCILGLHSYLKVCELLAVSTRLILHLLASGISTTPYPTPADTV